LGIGGQSSTPIKVDTIDNAIEVAAGFDHACALLSDGTATCWGGNYDGQLAPMGHS